MILGKQKVDYVNGLSGGNESTDCYCFQLIRMSRDFFQPIRTVPIN